MCGRYQFTAEQCEEIRRIAQAIQKKYGKGAWTPGDVQPANVAPVILYDGGELAQSERERALCSNACLLARALETQEGEPVFSSGREVLSGLRVEEIAALAATWSRFNREENPGLTMEAEQAEDVKKN